MKKMFSLLIALSLFATSLIGCSTAGQAGAGSAPDGGNGNSANTGEGTPGTYAIIGRSTGNPYVEKELEGFKIAIEELGGTAILKLPEAPTVEAQLNMLQEVIAQKVDCIAVASNDYDALQPTLTQAMEEGIKVLSLDSSVNPASRMVHINQADPERFGRVEIEAAAEMMEYEGQLAILSATSTSDNQNTWIEWMKEELKDEKYEKMELVAVVYGDDLRDKSVLETEGLLQTYPDLKCIVAPTTVGIAAAAKVVSDKGLIGKVYVTGLGLPSEMAEYIGNGACPWMYLWNPNNVGYLTGYAAYNLVNGTISGADGEVFAAGELGEMKVVPADDGGTQIMLGDPFRFDSSNIDEWKEVY